MTDDRAVRGTAPNTLGIDVLGPLRVSVDGRETIITAPKERALLEALALRAGRAVSTTELTGALWGEHPPASAAKTLQTYVCRLRKVVGDTAIITRPPGYALDVAPDQVDVHRFEQAQHEARRAIAEHDASRALDLFDSALQTWRGDPLADLADGDFSRAEIRRLRELRHGAVENRVAALLDARDPSDVVPELESLVALHPFRERLWGWLVVALYRAGRQHDALGAYRRARRVLIDELGMEPGPELRRLERAVLTQAPELEADGDVASLGSVGTPPARPTIGVPAPATRFIGRRRELEDLNALAVEPGLVTLVGPGGVGKTRLALELARSRRGWSDGTWWVELASLHDGSAVAEATSAAIGLRVPSERTALDVVVDALRTRRCLLLLDSCEHVIGAVRDLVARVVSECSVLTVVATSREALLLDGERIWNVEGLAVPRESQPPEGIQEVPAVALFVDRARAARSDFDVTDGNASAVAEITRRLDGLPLALELAASQMRSMGPVDLAHRLNERFRLLRRGGPGTSSRFSTLRSTVDWSYRLLEEQERRLFDRLSVFAGRFDLEAVEEVGRDGLDRADVSRVLARLVDTSMVVAAEGGDGKARYRLLDTLRHYAAERLAERGEADAVRGRHVKHYAALAQEAKEGVRTREEAVWVGRIEAAFDDLRVAHSWALEHDLGRALAIAGDLLPFEARNRAEVLSWAELAIDQPGAEDHEHFADACAAAARKAGLRGDVARAELLGRRSVEAAEARGSTPPLAALYAVALPRYVEADEEAIAQHLRRRDLALSVGDEVGASSGLAYAALIMGYRGDTARGLELAAEAMRLAEKAGSPSLLAGAHYVNGELLCEADVPGAFRHFDEALLLARSVHDDFTAGTACVSMASLHTRHGDPRRALELFRDAVASWHHQGAWRQQWVTLRNVAELFGRLGRHVEAAVLLGAIDVGRGSPPVFGAQADRLGELGRQVEDHLGAERAGLVADHGAAMGDDEAVRYACAAIEDALATV